MNKSGRFGTQFCRRFGDNKQNAPAQPKHAKPERNLRVVARVNIVRACFFFLLTPGSGTHSAARAQTVLMQRSSNNRVRISAIKYSSFYCFANIEHAALLIWGGGGGVGLGR